MLSLISRPFRQTYQVVVDLDHKVGHMDQLIPLPLDAAGRSLVVPS